MESPHFTEVFVEHSLMPEEGNLCSICKNVFERADYPPFFSSDEEHHKDTTSCFQAAMKGCYICSKIWNAVMRLADNKPFHFSSKSKRSFTEYGISNSISPAPVGVIKSEYRDPGTRAICVWKPGDGLPSDRSPDPHNRW